MGDFPIFEIGKDGAQFRIVATIDWVTTLFLAFAIFLGIVLALSVYAKMIK